MILDMMGLSLNKIFGKVLFIAFLLILVISFILIGVSAFSVGGSFGAVVNSLLPMGGGGAVGKDTKKSESKFSPE